MPFTWIHSYSAEAFIKAGCSSHGVPQPPPPYGKGGIEIQEARDNSDWLKDNLVCQYHNSADNLANDGSVNASDRSIHNVGFNTAQDVTHNSGYLSTAKSGDLSGANISEDLTAYLTYKGTYYLNNDATKNGTVKSVNDTSTWDSYNNAELSTNNNTVKLALFVADDATVDKSIAP